NAPAGRNRNRIDRPPGELRQFNDAETSNARDLRNIGRQGHIVSLGKSVEHGLESPDTALDVKTAPMVSRAAHRANTEPLGSMGIDLAIGVARNQDLDPMSAAEKRHHEMLAVPHGNDHRLFGLYGLIDIGGLDGETAREPYEPKILRGQRADKLLHSRRPRD